MIKLTFNNFFDPNLSSESKSSWQIWLKWIRLAQNPVNIIRNCSKLVKKDHCFWYILYFSMNFDHFQSFNRHLIKIYQILNKNWLKYSQFNQKLVEINWKSTSSIWFWHQIMNLTDFEILIWMAWNWNCQQFDL